MFGPQVFEKFGKTKKKGEILFCEYEPGDSLFFLQEGNVKITKIVKDVEKTLAILNPGDIFGEMAILEEAPRSATAIAENDVKLLEFDKKNFTMLVNAQPALAIKLLKVFANRIFDQKRKLMILNLPDDESKIMDVFLMLAENKNVHVEKTNELELDAEPETIANWSGLKSQDCIRILKNLQKNGKIDILPEKKIKIYNLYEFSRVVKAKRHSLERTK